MDQRALAPAPARPSPSKDSLKPTPHGSRVTRIAGKKVPRLAVASGSINLGRTASSGDKRAPSRSPHGMSKEIATAGSTSLADQRKIPQDLTSSNEYSSREKAQSYYKTARNASGSSEFVASPPGYSSTAPSKPEKGQQPFHKIIW